MNLPVSTADELYAIFLRSPRISIDSRQPQQGAVFFALQGERLDGNRYAADALTNGAAYAVVDNPDVVKDDRYLLVPDTLQSLQSLAQRHRRGLTARVLAITGSNGKTTTKELITAVLSTTFSTVSTRGNLNNHIGVPLTILSANSDTEMLVVEMGANHIGEIARLCEIAAPDSGIITNIGKAHLEGFGSLEGVKTAKRELYTYLSTNPSNTIIYHHDDDTLRALAEPLAVDKLRYGTSAEVMVRGRMPASGFQLLVEWENPTPPLSIRTQLVGSYNFANVMAAIATGIHFGVSPAKIVDALQGYTPANHRSQYIDTGRNRVVADCYNANPASMHEAIRHFLDSSTGIRTLILGDMLELGSYSREEHQKVLDMIRGLDCTALLAGPIFASLHPANNTLLFNDVEALSAWISHHPIVDHAVLIKGSRGIRLEKVLDLL
jgi:UDP-N-acetylmuramoyl-tripeptide--D-alanyl-D-alanine ligase